ncbi:MAG: hypothetical protein EOP49_41695 [Sphingobacteriales bacterium]|nr:MAG: hypothetical protein EOP49_41695 [Sphingobacteriales bacterium]
MKPKVVYDPAVRSGQLFYVEGDILLAFEYDWYKNSLYINIPPHYDNHPDPESAEQRRLQFIGEAVTRRLKLPCNYEIGETSIVIRRESFFAHFKSWYLNLPLGILLLATAIYTYFTETGKPPGDYHHHPQGRYSGILNPYLIFIAGLLFFASGYFAWRKWRRVQRIKKHIILHDDE